MSYKLALGFFRYGKKTFLKSVTANVVYFNDKHLTKTVLTPLVLNCNRCQLATDASSPDCKETLVYEGRLNGQIRRVKLFSLMTSLCGVFAQPLMLQRAAELGASTSTVVILCSTVGFFTLMTPLLLHFVTKKYVTSILYNSKEDSYILTTYTLFLRRKKLRLKPGDGRLPNVPGMFTTITIRGKPLFVDFRHFSDIKHYQRIMGYDRPMDFKLSASSKLDQQEDR